jgi:hypothetical protein
MAVFVVFNDVECVFPLSGQYGRAPRVLYYALILFVVGFRRQDWLTAGAAAACLIYGGTTAIHALLLAPSLALANPSIADGIVTHTNGSNIFVKALATDLDTDAALAIVGTGFLIVIPMALWSAQFRHSGAVPILVLWIILMFVGMLCSMAVLYGVNGSGTGPLLQHRFCTPGYNEAFPFSGDPAPLVNNNWNETVWNYFANSTMNPPSCIYPCLSTTYFLRQPGDLHVVKFVEIEAPSPLYWGMYILAAVIWSCVPLTIIFSITILVLRMRGHRSTSPSIPLHYRPLSLKLSGLNYLVRVLNFYGKVLIPFVFVIFLFWAEWILSYDLQSEEMQLVGQWAPLVGAGLVLVAAFVGKYWPRGERMLFRLRERRELVVRSEIKEGTLESLCQVWKKRNERSAWSHAGIALLQGDDLD